uniref:Uncharacterized protein n=1 Tax=Anguilla anguilla TaxID=7936 RepID=A0A0E9SX01_ANGAN
MRNPHIQMKQDCNHFFFLWLDIKI